MEVDLLDKRWNGEVNHLIREVNWFIRELKFTIREVKHFIREVKSNSTLNPYAIWVKLVERSTSWN